MQEKFPCCKECCAVFVDGIVKTIIFTDFRLKKMARTLTVNVT
jgi:hypothetical protein